MNKFSYKNDGIELMIEQENEFKMTDLIKLVQAIPTSPASVALPSPKELPFKVEPFKPSDVKPFEVKPYSLKGEDAHLTAHYQEEPNPIKDRLPNREQIRLNELKVEVQPHEQSQTFRCPSCAQSTLITVSNIALVRPFNTNCELFETNVLDKMTYTYEAAIQASTGEGDAQLIASEEILAHCPCCQRQAPTLDWMKHYEISADGRFKEEICSLCGEQLIKAFSGTTSKLICDNEACLSHTLNLDWSERD